MTTLQDLGVEIVKIRTAVDEITVKGKENAGLIVYISNKCNDLIRLINEAARELSNPHEGQNGEGAEIDGESNPGTAT